MFLKVLNRGQADEYYQLVDDIPDIIEDLEDTVPQAEYYFIKSTPGTVIIYPATIKTGPRADGRQYEIVELEADSTVVGSDERLK